MKRTLLMIIIAVLILLTALPCGADTDPILLDEPNENVFGCENDIFIELMEKASIGKNTAGRNAVDNFLYVKTEVLFLADETWNGIDKNSFKLRHTAEDGTTEEFPLNFAISTLSNLRNGWAGFGDELFFTSLSTINLVFDVDTTDKEGWTLLFSPSERGSGKAYCDMEIPLPVK